ncbi:uncharacterized protein LOC109602637 isoform X3 [Aethina tumida]|uniref:uncharacterized protein LOC109602637 isoform X3 n=1 Tax=Aethina tumida TaxID=116153 RepID=UPI002147C180|nr:uncharacterized protein LOC109602637 isoform X3 [Aethina tumida]
MDDVSETDTPKSQRKIRPTSIGLFKESVGSWLAHLRYSMEYYDEPEVLDFTCVESDYGDEVSQDGDPVSTAELQDYINIWDCTDLDYIDDFSDGSDDCCRAVECELHPDFCEDMPDSGPDTVSVRHVQYGFIENVVVWVRNLRYHCDDDEGDWFEIKALIQNTHDVGGSVQVRDLPFPTDESDFQFRNVRRYPRPQTENLSALRHDNKVFRIRDNDSYSFKDNSLTIIYAGLEETINNIKQTKLDKKDVVIYTDDRVYTCSFDSDVKAKKLYKIVSNNADNSFLTKFFKRRVSKDVLETKGIIMNEAVYGNSLEILYQQRKDIPRCIYEMIKLVEQPENIKCPGLYRTPGNLAVIQKIRLELDNNKLNILNNYEKDVDVLTGALKLFFRELKSPLICQETVEKILPLARAEDIYKDTLRPILTNLPDAHQQALFVLITHMLKILECKEENKMDVYNLAVCWGQSLIFYTDTKDLLTQSADAVTVVEFILKYYQKHPDALKYLQKVEESDLERHDSKSSITSIDKKKNGKIDVYKLLQPLVDKIERHLPVDGLYKKNGSNVKIEKLMKKLKKGKPDKLNLEKETEIYVIADALKKYLKELNILTKDTCNDFLRMHGSDQEKAEQILHRVEYCDTLKMFLQHMANVSKLMNDESGRETIRNCLVHTLCEEGSSLSDEERKSMIRCLLSLYLPPSPKLMQQPDLIKGIESNSTYNKKRQQSTYDNLHSTDL